MQVCFKWMLFVLCYVVVLALDISGTAYVFSRYVQDNFVYNARGYITSTKQCVTNYDDSAGHTTSGTLEVSFQFVDNPNSSYINVSTPVPGDCYDTVRGCCENWMDKDLYMDISESMNSTYTITGLSTSDKVHDDIWTVFGVGGILFGMFLVVILGCLIAMKVDRKNGYLPIASMSP